MAEKKSGVNVAAIVVLGIVGVCCLGSVGAGALGYTQFQTFLLRSKTSEASSNLRSLFQASASYYANESWGSGSALGGAAPTACTVDPATTTNTPGATKGMLDWYSTEPESFRAIGFTVADPIYYQYEIAGGPGRCGHEPSEPIYTLRAHGDLDGDGLHSLHELTVESDAVNELVRSPRIRTENELE